MEIHNELINNNWYLAGENYVGGKIVPALGYYILEQNEIILKNQESGRSINLKGIIAGNALSHTSVQIEGQLEIAVGIIANS